MTADILISTALALGTTATAYAFGWLVLHILTDLTTIYRHHRKETHAVKPNNDPTPVSVDWPSLIARTERKRIPVSRVDHLGNVHIIRSMAQLATEWENC